MSNDKTRYWVGILYPENMIPNWQMYIGDIIQYPYCYCIHNKDMLASYQMQEQDFYMRKTHVHLMIAFPNTTTYKHALSIMQSLSQPPHICINKVERIYSVRNMYEYLIHNTETSKKLGKYLYSPDERICGNNFDIGEYEQISTAEKKIIRKEITNLIINNHIYNYADLIILLNSYEDVYEEVLCNYSSHFERICRGNYLKYHFNKEEN